MLHVWLVPALALLVLIMVGFFLVVRSSGGDGTRKEGRYLRHEDKDDEEATRFFER